VTFATISAQLGRSDQVQTLPALIGRDLKFLDRLLDRRLLVRLIVDDADELSRRAADW
jgi:hypothetical protein